MARLVLCPSCAEFVARTERICPQCNVVLSTDRSTVANAAGAVLLGLSLGGCPADDDDDMTNTSVEPEYGVPATESDTVSTTNGMTMTSTSATGTMSTTASETSTVGEPEYGVPETESFTGGDTEVSTGETTGTSTGDEQTSIEPDYGVPESSG